MKTLQDFSPYNGLQWTPTVSGSKCPFPWLSCSNLVRTRSSKWTNLFSSHLVNSKNKM